ncbi:MAG TPA: LysR family transcriptional regulator ArgP [Ktedonobacterales bacterium]|nr:LysR family transcriptional regulator ArgP [Steroidobacteraceae bacterium]HEV2458491.1 LysR family transcriptional regulator ArgP [Ktedonobacterales bacterium]
MLDEALLAAVAAVAREGSFERAARVLHITPSAVSQRVKLLEERLGAVLIVRGQPCSATEIGARICRHSELVAVLVSELRRELPMLPKDSPDAPHASLRIAVNADSLSTWFIHAMAEFGREDAALLNLTLADEDRTAEWLRRGYVLGAVTSVGTAVQGCRIRRLGSLRYVATASAGFVRRWFAGGVSADALARAPSLLFDSNDSLQELWSRRIVRRDVALPVHRIPATQAFIDAALAGVGWGMNPLSLVRAHLKAGALVELVPDTPVDVPLYWQATRLKVPVLERLTRSVVRAAGVALQPS